MTIKVFQSLKSDIDFQAVATRRNLTVYEYLLSNGMTGHCFLKLEATNKWMLSNGMIVDVVKLLNEYEPETTGHHFKKRSFKRHIDAVDFAFDVTAKFVNTAFFINEIERKNIGKRYRVTISNLTDEQLKNFDATFPREK